ncbi:MAG: hypothetical protein WC465_00445 [Patescibacteria group bacterium]
MPVKFFWPIYGHQAQIKFLQSAIANQRVANAYLFYGPKGLGKKLTAQYFGASLFCTNLQEKPCGRCEHCLLIKRKVFLDIFTLGEQDTELSAENIREFLHSLSMSRVHNTHKLAIIYGVENMNLFGANAMLKILEEPPSHTTILLVADNINQLPATIISRCQLIKFQALARSDMEAWLKNYEEVNEATRETIINLSFGRPGTALTMLADDLTTFKKNCSFIIKLLAGNQFNALQTIEKWFEILKKENPDAKVSELGNMTKQYLDLLAVCLRDLLWIKLERPVVNSLYQSDMQKLAGQFSADGLLKNLLAIDDYKQKIKYNVTPQLAWENLFLSLK